MHSEPGAGNRADGTTLVLRLPDNPAAAGQARGAVRETLARWRLPGLAEACVLAASELVTNAVRHGRPPVSLVMSHAMGTVRIEVHDGGREALTLPSAIPEGPQAESGRGLRIAQAVADHLGSHQVPGRGKSVFVSWDVPPTPPAVRPAA